MMAGHQHFSYSPYECERFPTPPNQQLYHRQSPGLPSDSSNIRRLPPLAIPSSRDDIWQPDPGHLGGFPPSFALHSIQEPGSMQSPNSYPASYDASYHLHPSSYPPLHGSSFDTRHLNHPMHFPGDGHPPPHRSGHSGEWPSSSARAESHLVSPYARRDMMGHSPQEPSPVEYTAVKKKRKRADAAQLKILNEVYARTAFPTTEERLELAKKLDMSARSVQIWCVCVFGVLFSPTMKSELKFCEWQVPEQATINSTKSHYLGSPSPDNTSSLPGATSALSSRSFAWT